MERHLKTQHYDQLGYKEAQSYSSQVPTANTTLIQSAPQDPIRSQVESSTPQVSTDTLQLSTNTSQVSPSPSEVSSSTPQASTCTPHMPTSTPHMPESTPQVPISTSQESPSTPQETIKCQVCGIHIRSIEHLREHSRTRCRDLKKSFNTKSHIKEHLNTQRENWAFFCNLCQKGFMHEATMTKHLKTHKVFYKIYSMKWTLFAL